MFNRYRFRRDDIIDLVDLTGDNVFISAQNGSFTAMLQTHFLIGQARYINSCRLALIFLYSIVTVKWLSAICLVLATSN